ncbi:MAG: hypothetical protein EOO47_20460 [Flavobacterium sp.]|nr:MAG: hypothetical protein EOO47_20460 [Flavobacterium sp.]
MPAIINEDKTLYFKFGEEINYVITSPAYGGFIFYSCDKNWKPKEEHYYDTLKEALSSKMFANTTADWLLFNTNPITRMGGWRRVLGDYLFPFLFAVLISKILATIIARLYTNDFIGVNDWLIFVSVLLWSWLLAFASLKALTKYNKALKGSVLIGAVVVGTAISIVPETIFSKWSLFNKFVGAKLVYGCDDRSGEMPYVTQSGKLYQSDSFDYYNYKAMPDGNCLTENYTFLYWQTGVAMGYEQYEEPHRNASFSKLLELMFSIGPVFILESILRGLVYNLPFAILFMIGVLFFARNKS